MRQRNISTGLTVLAALFLAATLAGTGTSPVSPQQSAADLYQAALMKAEAEGDLNGAIKLFESLITRFPDTRELAAKAQLQIGACYEKLGLKQAQEAYEKVIEKYPDQGDAVKAAREKLALLVKARTAAASEGQEFRMRRIYDGVGIEWGNALSSDGRYFVYTDWATGDMAVVDLMTKESRRLTNSGGLGGKSGEMGETGAFSPDNKRLAYGWIDGNNVPELRVIDFDGSNPRLLLRDEESGWFRPHEWTPDGKQVLVTKMNTDRTSDIILVGVADGAVRVLRKVRRQDPEMKLSPDGRFVAYSMPPNPEESKRDVFLMNADGSGNTPLVAHDADDYLLGWSPDGGRVVFASDRMRRYGIWSIAVSDGRSQGQPELLKSDVGNIEPVRLTPHGALFYALQENVEDVLVAAVDPETGKVLGSPSPIPTRYSGANSNPDWSPDGRRLAYLTIPSRSTSMSTRGMISILDVPSGEERQLPADIQRVGTNDGPRWAPDGRSVLVIGGLGEEYGIYRVDAETGATTPLAITPPLQYTLHAVWSHDGRSLFYPQGNPSRILRHDLDTGKITELASMLGPAGVPHVAASPDGKWLAFTSREADERMVSLRIVPSAGGEVCELFRVKGATGSSGYIFDLNWTADSRFIWFRSRIYPDDPKVPSTFESWRISPDGSGLKKLELSVPGGGTRLHPDGRQIAYSIGRFRRDLWIMENFLPAGKK
jgi:Tol biopolymer transport system component